MGWKRDPKCDVAHLPTQRCPLRLCDQIDLTGKVIWTGQAHDDATVAPDAVSQRRPSQEAPAVVVEVDPPAEAERASKADRIEAAKRALTTAQRQKRWRDGQIEKDPVGFRVREKERQKARRAKMRGQ